MIIGTTNLNAAYREIKIVEIGLSINTSVSLKSVQGEITRLEQSSDHPALLSTEWSMTSYDNTTHNIQGPLGVRGPEEARRF